MVNWQCFCFSVFSESLQQLISYTMIRWAKEDFIENKDLVREMFSLLHRQYDGVGEVRILNFHETHIYIHEIYQKIKDWCNPRNVGNEK